jgi:predicted AAA+ superfamily ATPase
MEALSRNIGGFIRFLSIAAQCNGEQINFSNIARDVGLSDVTVKEYFKILEDTLLGTFLMPFAHSERKRHKLSPKFYFFDTGVLRATQKKLSLRIEPQTFEFGSYFETWIINEVRRISEYSRKDLEMSFLRTANNVETDLVITFPDGRVWAIEIKSKKDPIAKDFVSGFEALLAVAPEARCICVCSGDRARKVAGYDVIPYAEFFKELRAA